VYPITCVQQIRKRTSVPHTMTKTKPTCPPFFLTLHSGSASPTPPLQPTTPKRRRIPPRPIHTKPTNPTPNLPNSSSRNVMIRVAGRICSLFRTHAIHCWNGTRGRGVVVPPRTEARVCGICGQGCRVGFSR
jgi:hypothetical protein